MYIFMCFIWKARYLKKKSSEVLLIKKQVINLDKHANTIAFFWPEICFIVILIYLYAMATTPLNYAFVGIGK